jgi:large subunit ribosomal protein L4
MTMVDVHDPSGAKAGAAELPADLFDVTANIPLIHQVVVAQLAAARRGTHSTLSRGEVRGGGAKPYRQKGTGRARQGSKRAPQYVGGGTVHGPQPRSYAQRTPKKMIAAALRGALSDRARDGRVHVLTDLVPGDVPSTKTALAALRGVTDSDKVLVVLHRDEDLAWLSLRNVVSVHAITVDQLNAYDVLVNDEVVFTSAALNAFVEVKSSAAQESEAASAGPSEVSEPPAAPVSDPKVPSEPAKTEPDEVSVAPEQTRAEPDTSTEPMEAPGGPATTSGPVEPIVAPGDPSTGPAAGIGPSTSSGPSTGTAGVATEEDEK